MESETIENTEVQEMSVIETALAKANVTQAVIAALKAKQEAEAKAEAEKQSALELELSKGDLDKFADLITSLTVLKTKYTFKSAKYKKLQTSVNVLIDKITEYAINK